ncbi:glucose 1-dehydrogenase [Aureimonas fodinaquatilis]|uniref:Glucose 1-dehydrogenase n=1 Tax=Aureimonas fodinaquatilis TaxID=2565783 RepID=A0A5B0E0P6_9HYPH|nr:glucose 1-dehydrogenase [Aureimonas fodinaquatilis]KAA0971862.1 glucose 1-dehydrogenase [Aureimonas fodinaquatilis]
MNLFSLEGRVAIVTGGASGIGLAAARELAKAGATVTILDRAFPEEASEFATKVLDVTSEDAVAVAFDAIATEAGRLDILVNSAGIAIRRPALDLSVEDWNRVVDVNMTGSFLCAREAARHMIAFGNGGAIVNVASIMGLSGGGLYPNISYQTTKGAIINMTRALAVEWAASNIRVNAVAPTYVRTPFISALLEQPELMKKIADMTPLGRLAEPEEVAAAIVFLAAPASGMVTGHTLPVDGGFLAQ